MTILSQDQTVEQAPLEQKSPIELVVAIASLSVGGAERIVLDWASRASTMWNIRIIVLRNRDIEWPIPTNVRVMRVEPLDKSSIQGMSIHQYRLNRLKDMGHELAQSANPICICHLLSKEERDALGSSGAEMVPVLHNAQKGWNEDEVTIRHSPRVIAVSDACAHEIRACGYTGDIVVIRHIPRPPNPDKNAREYWRSQWNIPMAATVIGMIGAVKAQKDYSRALRILKVVLQSRNVYLVIVGGPVAGKKGKLEWTKVVDGVSTLGIRNRVALPGCIPHASKCLPAFDMVLNTSDFEGLSIATLEALEIGLPVVSSRVGGQGEIHSPGLHLMELKNTDDQWSEAIISSLGKKFQVPEWSYFESFRLWTLASLAQSTRLSKKTLFVTANLNSGGAQRSLVNLLTRLENSVSLSLVVAGDSSESYFYKKLRDAGVHVTRLSTGSKSFVHAEMLVHKICNEGIGTVCFWNIDPQIKLLVVKMLRFSKVRWVDVSPGYNSFDEMTAQGEYQRLIGFTKEEFYNHLDTLVMKYRGNAPEQCRSKTIFIPNGVPIPSTAAIKTNYSMPSAPRIVINGRIAKTKFILEIIQAMKLVRRTMPETQLHIFGCAELRERDYADSVTAEARSDQNQTVFFHGRNFETVNMLRLFDAYVVLGKDQGCPNALLEAMSVGMPCIANDDGGTREQIIDGKTGLLIKDVSPSELASAILRILSDRQLREKLGRNARARVTTSFSMDDMVSQYVKLFSGSCRKKSLVRDFLKLCTNYLASTLSQTKPQTKGYTDETTKSCSA